MKEGHRIVEGRAHVNMTGSQDHSLLYTGVHFKGVNVVREDLESLCIAIFKTGFKGDTGNGEYSARTNTNSNTRREEKILPAYSFTFSMLL